MAGSKSDYLEAAVLNLVFGATAYSAPATLYVALFTDSNTAAQRDAGTYTEVSTTSTAYARVAVTNNTTNWPAATGTSPTTKNNGADIVFPTATASWGTVTAFGIFDSATVGAGNLLYWGDLTVSQAVANGNVVKFAATTGLTFTED